MTEDHSKRPDCAWPDEPCNQLTFAEAMALDPSDVEVFTHGAWEPLERPNCPSGEFLISFLRKTQLRCRAHPKLSRVQEMANSNRYAYNNVACYHFGDELIRAVCEYLRKENIGAWAAPLSTSIESAADAIERHFLEPR